MDHKVAVLLCAHNAERFITEAIESILKQTYRDFDFIIIENGSTDNTWQKIKACKDPRIKAFQTPIKQLAFNLNYGLMQTQATYIARMDADDIAKPQRIERQLTYLEAHSEVDVLGTAFELFGDNNKDKTFILPETDKAIRKRLPFRFCFCHPSVMFKRELVLAHGGYQGGRYCQDVDLWLRLSRDKSVKFANLREVLLEYRIHPGQAKWSRETGILNASQLFRESLMQRSPLLFLGFLLAVIKLLRPAGRVHTGKV